MAMASLVSLLVWLLIVGLIFYVLWWAIRTIGVPEPFGKIIRVVLVVIVVIILINVLLGFSGHPFFNEPFFRR